MIRSGLVLVFSMILGRFLGLLREIILVKHYGTSLEADILIALITLPDILVALIVGNALPVVFLKRIQTMTPFERFYFLLKLSGYFLVVFGFLSIILSVFPFGLARLIFPAEYDNEQFILGLRWVVWTIPILCLNSITRVFLQSENKFFLIGLENVIFNVCIILGLFLVKGNLDITLVAFSLLVGSLLRWLTQMTQLFFHVRRSNKPSSSTPALFQLTLFDAKTYSIALLTGFSIQIMPTAARSLSSAFEGVGSLATFNYAYKLVELPIGLALTVLSTVLFPKLTHASLQGESALQKLTSQILRALHFVLPFSLTVALLLLALSSSQQLLASEKWSSFSLVLKLAAIGLVAFVIRCYNEVFVMILNANSDVKKPFKSAVTAVIVGLTFSIVLTYLWGIEGTFWAINLYYLTLVLGNWYFVRQSKFLVFEGMLVSDWLWVFGLCVMAVLWFVFYLRWPAFQSVQLFGFLVIGIIPFGFLLKQLHAVGKNINASL